MTTDALPVHAALSAVMGDVQAVRKGDRNEVQGFNFRGIDAVVNAVGPALRRRAALRWRGERDVADPPGRDRAARLRREGRPGPCRRGRAGR